MASDKIMTRRQILEGGAAAAVGLGLTASLNASNPSGTRGSLGIKNLIWIEVNGSLSQLDTVDPKPTLRMEFAAPIEPLATVLDRDPGRSRRHVGRLRRVGPQRRLSGRSRRLPGNLRCHSVRGPRHTAGHAAGPEQSVVESQHRATTPGIVLMCSPAMSRIL